MTETIGRFGRWAAIVVAVTPEAVWQIIASASIDSAMWAAADEMAS